MVQEVESSAVVGLMSVSDDTLEELSGVLIHTRQVCAGARKISAGGVGGHVTLPTAPAQRGGCGARATERQRERVGLRARARVDRARGHLRSSRYETASGLAPARGGVAVGRNILSAARMRNFDSPDVVFARGVSSCPPGPAACGRWGWAACCCWLVVLDC